VTAATLAARTEQRSPPPDRSGSVGCDAWWASPSRSTASTSPSATRSSRTARSGVLGEVVAIGTDGVVAMPLGDLHGLRAGDPVEATGGSLTVPVGPQLLGRVLDGLGRPIDDGPSLAEAERADVGRRTAPSTAPSHGRPPLHLGVRALDTLVPVGRGQRIGIMAGSGVGKSSLLSMIVRGTDADVSVLALIGERGREVREFIERDLGPEGMARSVVVVATSDAPALVRLRAAFAATRIAEWFRDQGAHVNLLMDSLTRFSMAQREIGLSAGEVPATRGYPPSVFALMPRLLERAGASEHGSITGIYTVLVEGDDLNDPIGDTARSILDGHIALSRRWPRPDTSRRSTCSSRSRGSRRRSPRPNNSSSPWRSVASSPPTATPRTSSRSVPTSRAATRWSTRPLPATPPSRPSSVRASTRRPYPARRGGSWPRRSGSTKGCRREALSVPLRARDTGPSDPRGPGPCRAAGRPSPADPGRCRPRQPGRAVRPAPFAVVDVDGLAVPERARPRSAVVDGGDRRPRRRGRTPSCSSASELEAVDRGRPQGAAMERLDERERERHAAEEAREEQIELDDLVSPRVALDKQASRKGTSHDPHLRRHRIGIESRLADIRARFEPPHALRRQPPAASVTLPTEADFARVLSELQSQSPNKALAAALVPNPGGCGPACGPTGTTLTAPSDDRCRPGGRLVEDAVQYLGVPYLWGGTNPDQGLDCSGFVQLVHRNLGIELPRVSRTRPAPASPSPTLADARPGDVLAFGEPVNHVAIYLGDGQMIHAPRRGDVVKIEPIDRPITAIRRYTADRSGRHAAANPDRNCGPRRAPRAEPLTSVPYANLFNAAAPVTASTPACSPRSPRSSRTSTPMP
jgi:cell wall-associated NlpC family hydrolase